MKTVNETTPLSESLFLKRNAFLSIAIGMSIISVIAARYSKYAFNDMGGGSVFYWNYGRAMYCFFNCNVNKDNESYT